MNRSREEGRRDCELRPTAKHGGGEDCWRGGGPKIKDDNDQGEREMLGGG